MAFTVTRSGKDGNLFISTYYRFSSVVGQSDLEHIVVHLKMPWGTDRVWVYDNNALKYYDRALYGYEKASFFLETCLRYILNLSDYSDDVIAEWSITDEELQRFKDDDIDEKLRLKQSFKKPYENQLDKATTVLISEKGSGL